MTRFTAFEEVFHVVTQVLLVDLLVQRTVLVHYHPLGLLVQQLYLVTDSVVDALIEYPEHVVLLPYVYMNVLEVLLGLEQLPVAQFLKLLFLHDFLQLREEVQ